MYHELLQSREGREKVTVSSLKFCVHHQSSWGTQFSVVTVFSCIRISCPTEIEYVMSNGPLVGFVAILQKCIIFKTRVLGVSLHEFSTVVENQSKSHNIASKAFSDYFWINRALEKACAWKLWARKRLIHFSTKIQIPEKLWTFHYGWLLTTVCQSIFFLI